MATERLTDSSRAPVFSHLHLLVLGSTLLVYNAPRVFRPPFAHEHNEQGMLRNYRFWYFVFFSIGLALALTNLYFMPWPVVIACGVLSSFAFTYTLPLLPFKKKKRLRDFGSLKILVLASVWTIATSVLPILYNNKNISNYFVEILLRFAFIFTLCVIFDIRDMEADMQQDLYTLPNKMGTSNSYQLINITLVIFVILSFIQYARYPIPGRLAGAILTAIITRMVATFLKKKPSDRAYTALADGVMLFYSFIVLIL